MRVCACVCVLFAFCVPSIFNFFFFCFIFLLYGTLSPSFLAPVVVGYLTACRPDCLTASLSLVILPVTARSAWGLVAVAWVSCFPSNTRSVCACQVVSLFSMLACPWGTAEVCSVDRPGVPPHRKERQVWAGGGEGGGGRLAGKVVRQPLRGEHPTRSLFCSLKRPKRGVFLFCLLDTLSIYI